jgi:hypothetical protein
MRHFRDRRPASFFRGSELPRLMMLVVMLGVLLLLMDRARDPDTWRWLAPGEPIVPGNEPAQQKTADDKAAAAGPTELDPAELDAAREELGAVADKVPLGKEEMPAYWRLMAWNLHQSTEQLRRRADKSVTFRDLWHRPEKWRAKLVEIPVHLRRTATVGDLEHNPLGLKTVYEVWGWNSDSQPYWYWMIVPELPPGMPQGESIYEEATFVGYFLKLLPYEDRQGRSLATPLLIGRLVWHPAPTNPLARRDEWQWTWYIAGALVVLFVVRWGMTLWGRFRRSPVAQGSASANDERAVEDWLDADESTPPEQIARETHTFDLDDDLGSN